MIFLRVNSCRIRTKQRSFSIHPVSEIRSLAASLSQQSVRSHLEVVGHGVYEVGLLLPGAPVEDGGPVGVDGLQVGPVVEQQSADHAGVLGLSA